MQWEKRILHSSNLTMLTMDEARKEYHMHMLPYPLLKHEVNLMKQKYVPECPTQMNLGDYRGMAMEDWEVSSIMLSQPNWRKRWLEMSPRDRIHYLVAL